MSCIIHIILGVLIGGAGFRHIAESPVQGISALFVAGYLVLCGLEKWLLRQRQKVGD
ncbi:MAG: hypothetical protein AB9866_28470 [Syntrophobacteraceae bacterium]